MYVGVLRKGDRVLNVTPEFVAVERKNGEVDILPLVKEGELLRIDTDNTLTIGYGDNVIEASVGDISITTF